VYASATGRAGLLKSVDAGHNWLPLTRGLPSGFAPVAMAAAPRDGRVVLVAGVDGLYRSTTAGSSWIDTRAPLAPVTALLFDREAAGTVLAGTEIHGNYRSTDGGMTWVPSMVGLPRDRYGMIPGAVQFVQHPTNAATVFMATNGFGGVYRSDDGGRSWTAHGAGLSSALVSSLSINPAAPDVVWAVTDKGLARSADGAQSWQGVASLPPVTPVAVEFEPGSSTTVFVAGAKGTLLRSTNGGATWVGLPSLPGPVRSLAAWGNAPDSILAAAAGEGVWELQVRPTLPASPEPSGPNRAYFAETGHNVSPTFYPFFRGLGGVDRFGYPRTDEFLDNGVLVQYFQRGRLEYHPERKGTAYEVQISLLGQALVDQEAATPVAPFESSAEQRYFEETGHSVSYAFLRAFNARGLDSLGFPLTEELKENGRPVQYFQRARLEYLQEFAGTRDEVQLGLIGDDALRQRGWLD
jgi:hypothetical protein